MTADGESQRKLLVSDFDGTLTRRDFFWLVVEAFAPANLQEHWRAYREGRSTHFEALAGIFAAIRAGEEEMRALLARAELEPRLREWLGRLALAGWDVVVASAGCEWYIRRILAGGGVELPVYANPGTFVPGAGLQMRLPPASPYFSPTLGIDKAAIVRRGLEQGREVAFAGDGTPDVEAAKLVPAERRFARADLAAALDGLGLPYRHFERWAEVAEALCERR